MKISWTSRVVLAALAMGCGQGAYHDSSSEKGDSSNRKESEASAQLQQAISYSNHEYLFVANPKNWDEAQAHCRSVGNYDLVTINDAYEEAWLNTQENGLSSDSWWIGYTDQGSEGTWRWLSGLPSNFENWSSWNPDNYAGEQHCAADNYQSGRWDDQNCFALHPFVCEEFYDGPAQAYQTAQYADHEYLFVANPKNWDDAEAYCRSIGNYDLVTINDAYEETWLNTQENSLSGDSWWIGYTDRGSEGSWRWLSGLPSTYENWSSWNPDNYAGQQHCAADNYQSDRWDDQDCLALHPFVCEK